MKIAIVAPSEIPARRANTVQVMKMAQAMTIIGHDVHLAAPSAVVEKQNITWEALAQHYGLRHKFQVEWLAANPRLRRYDYSLGALRWARRWRADLFYTRLPQAAALASLSGLATILEVHDLPQGRLGPPFFRLFFRGRGARRLVVITRSLADDLADRLGLPGRSSELVLVSPDGVDLERYANLPSVAQARKTLFGAWQFADWQHLSSPGQFVAGYTGHLYAGRGIDLILTLAERLQQVIFLLAGGEPGEVERVREDAQARRLNNLILTGFIPNADLPLYQAACDVLLMPYEQRVAASSGGDIARYLSPMKLFEYLACGRAILSSDLPVLREALNPGNAILLPPPEPHSGEGVEAWAVAIEQLQGNPTRRAALGGQALQDAQKYTWEARARRILV